MLNFFLIKKVVVRFILFHTFFTNYLSQKGFCAPSVVQRLVDRVKNLEDHDSYRQVEIDRLQEKVYLLESQVGGRASILIGNSNLLS